MIRRIFYIIDEAFRTVKRHKGLTSISIIIMSLSLLMLAVFLLATDNVLKLVGQAQEEMKIYVYLEESSGQGAIEGLYQTILQQPEVATVNFVPKDQALEQFRAQLGEGADMLDALRNNPLPNAFHVEPRSEFKNRDAMVALSERFGALAGVEEVRYGKEFVDKFQSIVRAIYYVDAVVGFIVILSAVFIIANAVRLTVISRRKTIDILKLVGATNSYIVAPFIIEGAFQAGVAAIISLVLLRLVTEATSNVLPDITFFTRDKALLYFFTSVMIGAFGSVLALRKILRAQA